MVFRGNPYNYALITCYLRRTKPLHLMLGGYVAFVYFESAIDLSNDAGELVSRLRKILPDGTEVSLEEYGWTKTGKILFKRLSWFVN